MARGAVRGILAGAGGLIVLQMAVQTQGADAVGGLLGAAAGIVRRCLDPSVPAIPDHSKGSAAAGTTDNGGNFHPSIPGYLGGGTVPSPGSTDNGGKNNNGFQLVDPPPPGQHNPAYDNPSNTPYGIPELYRVPYLAPVTRNT
jgi:hypothetical protein